MRNLTDREKDILQLLRLGYDVKEIARALNRSHHTVFHIKMGLHVKFDVHSTFELIEATKGKKLT